MKQSTKKRGIVKGAFIPNGNHVVFRGPLTKNLLLSAAEGIFIISTVGGGSNGAFAEPVVGDREQIWKRIVALGANGRMCIVTFDEPIFREWKDRMNRFWLQVNHHNN